MTEPRRHHFLPQFYLRGFTATGSPDGALHLLRPSDGHEWRGTPDSVGHQRDFYRIDGVPGVEPNQLERNFAVMEGQVGGVLGNVLSTQTLPTNRDDLALLLDFVAVMTARVPMHLEMLERPLKELASKVAHIAARSVPVPSVADVGQETHDQLRELVDKEGLQVEISREFLLDLMLQSIETISPLLAKRQWALLISNPSAEFVTCDAPVAVVWSDRTRPEGFFGPAFGGLDTDVTLPLSRRVALLGTFGGSAGTREVDARVVADVNTRTGRKSGRFICWSGRADSFVWLDPTGQIGTYEALVKAFSDRTPR